MENTMHNDDTTTPISHFSNCHVGIFAQLARMGDLPALLGPAAQARKIADQSLAFFSTGMYTHHSEEEKDLFPAVRASAQAGAERMKVDTLIEQLTKDHRSLEKLWESLEPSLRKVSKGQDTTLDVAALDAMVQRYQSHAKLEEQAFLPLAQSILGRNDNHMAALGLTLHMRHVPAFAAHI
jgi:iron-sulfur cluster repair protein YtfE (RIC family)